jgi:hypothetical protein
MPLWPEHWLKVSDTVASADRVPESPHVSTLQRLVAVELQTEQAVRTGAKQCVTMQLTVSRDVLFGEEADKTTKILHLLFAVILSQPQTCRT